MIDLNDAPRQSENLFEDAKERTQKIKKELQQNIKRLVDQLFPNARVRGNSAEVGSLSGESGKSMWINLVSSSEFDEGAWKDHATGERGDVLQLFQEALGLRDLNETLTEAEKFLGHTPSLKQAARKVQQEDLPPKPKPNLINEIDYVYRSKEGRRLATVYRREHDDGSKSYPVIRNDGEWTFPVPRTLYKLEEIHDLDKVVLVEGEKCVEALREHGIAATSAMGGANALLEKTDFSPLAGKTVTLWPDHDEPGYSLMARIQPILEKMGCTVKAVAVPKGKPNKWDAADASPQEIKALLEDSSEPQRKQLPILDIDELADIEPPEWLIENVLVKGGLSTLFAPAETFKSFIALDMALSVSCGQAWRGRATISGPVVYLIGEGVSGWPARVFTWLKHRHEGEKPVFYTVPTSIQMNEKEDAQALIDLILNTCPDPSLIVVDTLARNFGGGDENSTQDMNAFVRSVDEIRHATGAHMMLVHHTGKDVDKGGRGSSVLRAALDTELQCKRDDPDGYDVTLKITKQKDIEKDQPIHFEMKRVEAVHPKTGEVIFSLIPVLTDGPSEAESVYLTRKDREVGEWICDQKEPFATETIAANFSTTPENIRKHLRKLAKKGEIHTLRVGNTHYWAWHTIPINTVTGDE